MTRAYAFSEIPLELLVSTRTKLEILKTTLVPQVTKFFNYMYIYLAINADLLRYNVICITQISLKYIKAHGIQERCNAYLFQTLDLLSLKIDIKCNI